MTDIDTGRTARPQTRLSRALALAGPWAPLLALLAWAWRLRDLVHTLPAYADVLELTWGVTWYDQALRAGQSPFLYPLAFFPEGWHTATFAAGPVVMLLMLPLHWLGGAALAYNVATLLTFVAAYAGMFLLARRFFGPWAAAVAATLYAFCAFRNGGTIGHLNMLLASACLPWIAWAAEQGYDAVGRRRVLWWLAAGACWGLAISASLYFAWIGGLVLLAWAVGRAWAGGASGRAAWLGMLLPVAGALLLSSPSVYLFLKASAASSTALFDAWTVNSWGSSLNSLAIPPVQHPWLGSVARAIYRAPVSEQGRINLGLLAVVVGLAGAWLGRRERRARPLLLLAPVGVILALGLTLKWDNQSVSWPALQPLNVWLWSVGHRLKPAFFQYFGGQVPAPFDTAVPLPGLLLSMVVPYLEQSRVFARYAVLSTLALSLLAALALTHIRRRPLAVALGALLILEIVPAPLANVPFPPAAHPAFEWLRAQDLAGGAIADVAAWNDTTLVPYIRGEAVWETLLTGQPTVAGASSVWPAHTAYLNDWLSTHPQPFGERDFAALLRAYGVRYLVFHELGTGEALMVEQARQDPRFRVVGRFPPPAGPGPWPYPISVVEVLPEQAPQLALLLQEGWSGREAWGAWVGGTWAEATWIAIHPGARSLHFSAFPLCAPGRPQGVLLRLNGVEVGQHIWAGCDPWEAEIALPAELVSVGANKLELTADWAASPAEATAGQNPDSRPLSIGVTIMSVEP